MLYDGAGSSCIPKLQLKQTNRKASRLQLLLINTNAQDALIDTISVPELTKLNSVKLVFFFFFFFFLEIGLSVDNLWSIIIDCCGTGNL